MKTRKKLGVALTLIGAIAFIAYRATTLGVAGSAFNWAAFFIETSCIAAFVTEAVLLSVQVPVKKLHSSEAEIMHSASKVLSTNTIATSAKAKGGDGDTKVAEFVETIVSKYIEEADVVVFVESATPTDLRRNFLSLKGIEGIKNVNVIDPSSANSTKELCEEFNYSMVSNFAQTEISTATYLVCRGVDIVYPDVINLGKQYDFKAKSWLELRSVFSDEHVFGGHSSVVVDDKRQMLRDALSTRSLAHWSTGPALIGADNLETFATVTRAQDFFNTCEQNGVHGITTDEIASEEVSQEQTYSDIIWRNLELSYIAKSFGAKYNKPGQKFLGALIKIFAFFTLTSIVRRLALGAAIAYVVIDPSTLEYMTTTFLTTYVVLAAVIFAGSYLAGDDRPFVARIREYYFDVEASVWGLYSKALGSMAKERRINFTKRMPFTSLLLIAIDAVIVYRVIQETNAQAGTYVVGIPRNVSMIAGYSLIVSLLFGLSMVVVTQLRKSVRREVSRGAIVNGEPVSMVDLSPGGAGIIATASLEVGTHVRFKTKLSTTNGESLECSATVRSCVEKSGNFRIGLEFEELLQCQVDELETYCLITYPHALARNVDGVRERSDSTYSKVNGKTQKRALAYACSFVALGSVFYSNISHWL